jgi:hypothetical protein
MIQLLLALLLSLPAYYRDVETPAERLERMTTVAQGISNAVDESTCTGAFERSDWCKVVWPGSRNQLAALLVTEADSESHLAAHVHAGRCRANECDGGWAHGIFQQQPGPWLTLDEWQQIQGVEIVPTTLSALAATRHLSSGLKRCRSIEGAISFYARPSTCRWPGAALRMPLYRRTLKALMSGSPPENASVSTFSQRPLSAALLR